MTSTPLRDEVWLIGLDPTLGSEIKKTRPCVVVSPDEMNRHLQTIVVAPMTTAQRAYPTRVDLTFQRKAGQVALDQIRTVDRSRMVKKLGKLSEQAAESISNVLLEMFRRR